MTKSISIVTFISGTETLNWDIIEFYKYIARSLYHCELIIYADHEVLKPSGVADENIREMIGCSITKYRRILSSLETCKYNHILFIDNDIKINYKELRRFIIECPNHADLYFGKISVKRTETFTEHLVKIDKILSHNIIRPALWNMNVGISIPGQIFIMKRKSFIDILKRYDTLFDDLTIGICAKENHLTVKRTKAVLGSEMPSVDLKTLICQRVRWAKGYSQTLKYNIGSNCFPCIIIHGTAYHATVAILDLVTMILLKHAPCVSVTMLLLMLFILSDNNINEFLYVIPYMLIFPWLHIIWLCALMKNLIMEREEQKVL